MENLNGASSPKTEVVITKNEGGEMNNFNNFNGASSLKTEVVSSDNIHKYLWN